MWGHARLDTKFDDWRTLSKSIGTPGTRYRAYHPDLWSSTPLALHTTSAIYLVPFAHPVPFKPNINNASAIDADHDIKNHHTPSQVPHPLPSAIGHAWDIPSLQQRYSEGGRHCPQWHEIPWGGGPIGCEITHWPWVRRPGYTAHPKDPLLRKHVKIAFSHAIIASHMLGAFCVISRH